MWPHAQKHTVHHRTQLRLCYQSGHQIYTGTIQMVIRDSCLNSYTMCIEYLVAIGMTGSSYDNHY